MIKFFRKIRQKLLAESKFSKYLIYAIGEIVLVVVGILIALQINNWNENNKNEILISTYKKGLIENLKKDSTNIADIISKVKEDLANIAVYEERVSNSQNPLDTLMSIARYEFNYMIALHYNFENDTYQALNSTGHLSLFSTDTIKELNELNNLQKESIFATNKLFTSYSNSLLNYSRKYPFSLQTNLIQNGTKISDEIWDNVSLRDHATAFNSIIILKGDCYRIELIALPTILEKTTSLLNRLHEDLKLK
jgi:hypothetical protein